MGDAWVWCDVLRFEMMSLVNPAVCAAQPISSADDNINPLDASACCQCLLCRHCRRICTDNGVVVWGHHWILWEGFYKVDQFYSNRKSHVATTPENQIWTLWLSSADLPTLGKNVVPAEIAHNNCCLSQRLSALVLSVSLNAYYESVVNDILSWNFDGMNCISSCPGKQAWVKRRRLYGNFSNPFFRPWKLLERFLKRTSPQTPRGIQTPPLPWFSRERP